MLLFLLLALPVALCAQSADIEIEPLRTSITVRETLEAESSGYVTAVEAEELDSRPGVNLDDRLRDIPGFSLFRRSSSLVAHPTTQGVSLRGIGSSAAGRTLVLYDGFPANDPFGGWVYWSRMNPDAVEVIEVSRGATTSAYGDRAMGGTISVLTRIPEVRHIWASAEGGSAGIADARGGYSNLFGKFGVSSFVRGLRSEGYYIVDENLRGSVDRRADVDFLVGDLRLDYFGNRDRLTFKTNLVSERRQNGTALRENSSSVGTAGVNYQRGGFAVNAYHSRGALRNAFSFVNATRTFERQTLLQRVASEDTGGSILWSRGWSKGNLLIGADTHRAEGLSTDTVVSTGFIRRPGGRLWQQGAFVQGMSLSAPRQMSTAVCGTISPTAGMISGAPAAASLFPKALDGGASRHFVLSGRRHSTNSFASFVSAISPPSAITAWLPKRWPASTRAWTGAFLRSWCARPSFGSKSTT